MGRLGLPHSHDVTSSPLWSSKVRKGQPWKVRYSWKESEVIPLFLRSRNEVPKGPASMLGWLEAELGREPSYLTPQSSSHPLVFSTLAWPLFVYFVLGNKLLSMPASHLIGQTAEIVLTWGGESCQHLGRFSCFVLGLWNASQRKKK